MSNSSIESSEPGQDARISLTISPTRIRRYLSQQTIKERQLTLLKSSPHPSLPISIINYTNDTEWHRQWDDLTMAARVLVIEPSTGTVVSRAFSKFFNWDERDAYRLPVPVVPVGGNEHIVEASIEEKLDGSIITLFFYRNQWIVTSKSSFNSKHVDMAREVLNEKYPYLMTAPSSSSSSSTSSSPIQSLDTNKTYIFELIHPQNPTHVRYTYKDLVLLSIVGKDGSEPPPDFNWSIYPFPRPTYHDIPISDFPAIQRLNRSNEEGFIVKIYPLPSSTSTSPFSFHPQRIKVKFESYLELIKSKNYIIGGGDQTPNELAEVYRRKRGFIYTFNEAQVVRRMGQDKDAYFDSVRRISDDFGGPEWVNGLMDMWNEAETAFMEAEAELLAAMNRLMADGFEAQVGTEDVDVKRRFAQRIMQEPEMSRHKNTLFAWFGGGPIEKQVAMFVSSVKVNSRKEQTKKTKE